MKHAFLALLFTIGLIGSASAQDAGQILNTFRQQNGLHKVTPSPMLEQAAKAHAMDMANKDFFKHTGSDGSNVMRRVRRTGYRPCAVAENIAYGQKSVAEVMEGWAGSQGHRKNMLSKRAEEFGLARAPGNIWVLVMAQNGC